MASGDAATAATPAAVEGAAALPSLGDEPAIPLPLQELLERLPHDPGVYLMKDKKGRIIYVGKARNLRSRVRSYFNRSGDSRAFVKLLHRLLGDIETVVTSNEKEALLLENTLIKQHKPRFNVKLIDDKNYLVLRLDEKARFPRLEVTRRIRDDGARYFGPYHSASSCRQTLRVVNRHFKLRTCTDQVLAGRKRPCLQYQIKRCDAPCVLPVDKEHYADQVRDVALFLDRKDDLLTERLRLRMLKHSDELEFEQAGLIRDQLKALQATLQEQNAVSTQFLDQDVFGYHREGDVLEIAVLFVRQGRLLGRKAHRFTGQEFPDEEAISAFVGLYYDRGAVIPDEVLLPLPIEDLAAKQEWLRDKALTPVLSGQVPRPKVVLLYPQRGPRQKLVELANRNARVNYSSKRDTHRDAEVALAKLQNRLGLLRLPRRIECFDISHLQGSYTVASRVVFVDGEPARALYRTFRVRSVANDDFAAMYEVLSRRFRRALTSGAAQAVRGVAQAEVKGDGKASAAADLLTVPDDEVRSPAMVAARKGFIRATPAAAVTTAAPEAGDELDDELEVLSAGDAEDEETHAVAESGDGWALPDLLVIDGGKGQLATGLAALKDVGIAWTGVMDVVGLAKEREDGGGTTQPDRVFLPRTKEPIKLRPNTAEMFVLSRIRDEAHRFAVTFHKKLREKGTIRSQLAEIPGVGPKRQSALLTALGSVRKIREATLEQLCAVPGMSLGVAQEVFAFYHGPSGKTSARAAGEAAGTGAATGAQAAASTPVVEDAENVAEDAASQELLGLGLDDTEAEADPADTLAGSIAALTAQLQGDLSGGAEGHEPGAAKTDEAG